MDTAAALKLIYPALDQFAAEAQKPTDQRGRVAGLDFSYFEEYLKTFHYSLRQTILNSPLKNDPRFKDFLRYKDPILSVHSNLLKYLYALTGAMAEKAKLDNIFKEVEKQMLAKGEEPVNVTALRAVKAMQEHKELEDKKAAQIAYYQPVVLPAMAAYQAELAKLFSLKDPRQLAYLQETLLNLSPEAARMYLYHALGKSATAPLGKDVGERVENFINLNGLVYELRQEAVNRVFMITVQGDAVDSALKLLPTAIITNERDVKAVLTVIKDDISLGAVLPKEVIVAKLAQKGVQVAPETIDEVYAAIKTPTKQMLTEPLRSDFASFRPYQDAKNELTKALQEQQAQHQIRRFTNYSVIERLSELAIEESMQAVIDAQDNRRIADIPTHVTNALNQTLQTHNVTLSSAQMQRLTDDLVSRVRASAYGMGLNDSIAQAVNESAKQFGELQKVTDSGSRVSEGLIQTIQTNVATRVDVDVPLLVRQKLAQVLIENHAFLSAEATQALVREIAVSIGKTPSWTDIDLLVLGQVEVRLNLLLQNPEFVKNNPEFAKLVQSTPAGQAAFRELLRQNILEGINLSRIQSLPAGEQRDAALTLIVKASLNRALTPHAQQVSGQIVNQLQSQAQLRMSESAVFSFLKENSQTSREFFAKVVDASRKQSKLWDTVARQVLGRDKTLAKVQNLFIKRASVFMALVSALSSLLGGEAQPTIDSHTQQAQSDQQTAQAAGGNDEGKKVMTEGEMVQVGGGLLFSLLELWRQRREIVANLLKNPLVKRLLSRFPTLQNRLLQWSLQKPKPSALATRLANLRFFNFKGITLTPGSLFSAHLQFRFPRLFSGGRTIFTGSGMRAWFGRMNSLFGGLGRTFGSIFGGGLGKLVGLLPRLAGLLAGPAGWALAALSMLPGIFSKLGQGDIPGAIKKLPGGKYLPYIIVGILLAFFMFFLPGDQTIIQTAFVAPINGQSSTGGGQPPPFEGPGGPGFTADCPIPGGKIICGSLQTPINGCGHCNPQYCLNRDGSEDQLCRLNCNRYVNTRFAVDIAGKDGQDIILPKINGATITWTYLGQEAASRGNGWIQKFKGMDGAKPSYYLQLIHTKSNSANVSVNRGGIICGVADACWADGGTPHVHVELAAGTSLSNALWLDAAQVFKNYCTGILTPIANPQPTPTPIIAAAEQFWFILHRKSNLEYLYNGNPDSFAPLKPFKTYQVKTGIAYQRPTPLHQLYDGRNYWLITEMHAELGNEETSPYFITLNIPSNGKITLPSGETKDVNGPVPYKECIYDNVYGQIEQCDWVTKGDFGLHGVGVENDESKLSPANPGSSGCIRHRNSDISEIHDLIQAARIDLTKNPIRYYVVDD